MKKINIDSWREFEIRELFNIRPTKYHSMINRELLDEDGKNPVIVNSSLNNGIGGYSNQEITEIGNVVTFSDTTTSDSIFYQPESFVGYSHVQVIEPKVYLEKWNQFSWKFFVTIFKKKANLMNFDYVNKFTREDALNIKIKLPVKTDGTPDFEYMENFIKQLYTRERESSELVAKYVENAPQTSIKIEKWKRFNLYDKNLFIIHAGTKLDKKNMTTINPTINFVGRSNFNNGVTEKVDLINDISPYSAGSLTMALGGAYLGSCFVQQDDFYTSQNVIVLEPIKDISFNSKLFIATMIFKESQTYYKAFEDELNRHIKTDFSIFLPVKNDGTPDFEYMDNYIAILQVKQNKLLKTFKN